MSSLPTSPLGSVVMEVLRVFDAYVVDGENFEELELAMERLRAAVAVEVDRAQP